MFLLTYCFPPMRQSAIILLLCLSIMGLSACKTSYTTPEDYPKTQLVFGSGGGFAGTVNTYYLLEDGSVFHEAPRDTTAQKIRALDKQEAKALLAEAEALDIPTRQLNAPGNMYAFIEWRTAETRNRLVWDLNNANSKVDPALQAFHKKLMQLSTPMR
jgi:hypothetical protein